MNKELSKWNRLIKKQDEVYHRCAKRAGLADAQFWVLYALCEAQKPLCQNTFCENWCYSKQTVCTAVASLEKAGLVQLAFAEGSRKQKDLFLTEKGEMFCDQHIRSVLEAEEKVLQALSGEERERFFAVLENLLDGLDRELS